jgi:hypothetical protein
MPRRWQDDGWIMARRPETVARRAFRLTRRDLRLTRRAFRLKRQDLRFTRRDLRLTRRDLRLTRRAFRLTRRAFRLTRRVFRLARRALRPGSRLVEERRRTTWSVGRRDAGAPRDLSRIACSRHPLKRGRHRSVSPCQPGGRHMLRKLFFVAALVLTTAAATTAPAPAIDFACTCRVCAGGTGPACRDGHLPFATCASWWAIHSSECQ